MLSTRILLADDNEEFLQGLASSLADRYELAGCAADGDDLVRLAQSLQPDIIVSDIGMPGMSGLEAAQRIRRAGNRAGLIFLTVESSPTYVKRALHAGAEGYVLKMHAAEQLDTAIDSVLGGGVYISPEIGYKGDAASGRLVRE